MGIIFDILGAPLLGPVKGIKWIAEKVDEVVKQTTSNKTKLKSDLLEISMQFELGKISEEEFNREEKRILGELERVERNEK